MLDHYRTMACYNRWFNQRLYAACEGLSDTERKRDVGAFFASIHATLNHILLADRVWLGRFSGRHYPVDSLDQELYADFAALHAAREAEDESISVWVADLDESALQGTLRYTSIATPEPREYPLWFTLSHFFNHQTHHRGQITALLSQRGVDVGVTDLIALPRDHAV